MIPALGQHLGIAGTTVGDDIAGRMKRLGQDEVISGGLPVPLARRAGDLQQIRAEIKQLFCTA
jgi:hypothetical protein